MSVFSESRNRVSDFSHRELEASTVLLRISEDNYRPVSDLAWFMKALLAVLAEFGVVGGSHEISPVPFLQHIEHLPTL